MNPIMNTIPLVPFENLRASSEIGKNYHLECTQCGKCCSDGPQLTFLEAFALRDTLPMRMNISVSSAAPTDAYAMAHIEFAQKMGVLQMREGLIKKSIYVSPFTYQYQNGRCIALSTDGSCSIYAHRPSICKSVPMVTFSPDSHMAGRLDSFGEKFGCLTKKEGSELSVEGLNENRRAIYDDVQYSSMAALIMAEMVSMQPGRRSVGSVHIAILFEAVAQQTQSNVGHAKMFAESQLALLKKLVADAIQRKNKSDMPVTREYREMIQELEAYLSPKI